MGRLLTCYEWPERAVRATFPYAYGEPEYSNVRCARRSAKRWKRRLLEEGSALTLKLGNGVSAGADPA